MVTNSLVSIKKNAAAIVLISGLLGVCDDSRAASANNLTAAQNYYQVQDFASAIIELKNALQTEPKNVAARKLLGKIYFQQGNFIAAEKELERAYRVQQNNPQVILSYAKVLLRINNLKQFEQVLKPTMSWTAAEKNQAHSLQLLALIEQNKEIEAKELLDSPQFSEATSIDATYAKALYYSHNKQLAQSQDLLTSLLQLSPNHLEGILLQGDLLFFDKDYENALIHYQKASELQPLNPRLKIKIVRALLGQQKLQSAENILTQVLKQSPLFHEASFYYGYIKLQQQDFEMALEYANKVLRQIPGHPESQYIAAKAAYSLKQYETSYRFSSRLAARFPNHSAVLKLLASNQLNLKLNNEAIVTLEKIADTELQQQDALLFLAAASSLPDSDDPLTRKKLYLQAEKAAPKNQAIKIELAAISFSQGSADEGNKYLQAALAQDPSSAKIKAALISGYLSNNQLSKAQTAIEQLIADDENNSDGYYFRGLLYLIKNNHQLASVAFKQALAISPGDPKANHNLAIIAIIAKDFTLAKSYYLETIKYDPANIRALTQLSLLDRQLNNHAESLAWLQQAARKKIGNLTVNLALAERYIEEKKYQPAIELLHILGKIFVKEWKIRLLLGQAYHLNKQPQLALAQFKRAVILQPQEAAGYLGVALIHEQTGKLDNALTAANKGLALVPENREVLKLALRLSLKTGQLVQAKSLVEKLIVSFPDDVQVQEFEAKLAVLTHDYKRAVALFSDIFKRHQTNFILVQLAHALVKNDQRELAVERMTSWLIQQPNDLLVLNLLANEYMNHGQADIAQQYYAAIVKLTPNNSQAQNNLAWLLFKQGKVAQAQHHAEHAYKVSPQSPMILDTLGQVLLAQGNYTKSRLILNLASRKMPDNLETKFYLAQATALNGDKSTAKSLLQQILAVENNETKVGLAVRSDSQRLLAELQN